MSFLTTASLNKPDGPSCSKQEAPHSRAMNALAHGPIAALAILLFSPSLRPVSAADNLLANGGFEEVNPETGLPEKWTPLSRVPAAIMGLDEKVFHSGKRALHMNFNEMEPPGPHYLSVYRFSTRLSGETTYTFSCWIRTENLKGSAGFELYEYPAPIPKENQHSSKMLSKDNDWTRLSVTFRSRSEIQSVQVRCVASSQTPNPQGEVWFDDCKLEEGSAPTDFVNE